VCEDVVFPLFTNINSAPIGGEKFVSGKAEFLRVKLEDIVRCYKEGKNYMLVGDRSAVTMTCVCH